jgi:putative multiple sugar transport system substrate-binding protein
MSIFKDTRALAAQTVKMVDAIIQGKEAEVNDTESYDNGKGIIPTFLCEPQYVDKSNYQELLLDSGYYTADQVK